jgi:hypothetical protein
MSQVHFKSGPCESSPILLPNNLAQQLYRYTFVLINAIFESDMKSITFLKFHEREYISIDILVRYSNILKTYVNFHLLQHD